MIPSHTPKRWITLGSIAFICLLLGAVIYKCYYDPIRNDHIHETYPDCSEEISDFIDYCSQNCIGDVYLRDASVYNGIPTVYMEIRYVTSLDEANNNISLIKNYIEEDEQVFANENFYFQVSMVGQNEAVTEAERPLYITYCFNSDSTHVSDVYITKFSIPVTDYSICDFSVQTVHVGMGDLLSDSEVSILESVFPDATIVFPD